MDRLNGEIHKALAAPDLNKRLASNGVETFVSTPLRLAEFIKSETIRFAKLVKDSGIKAE